MKMTDDDKRAVIAYRLEKAYGSYEDAVKVAGIELWNIAANRLFYSLYYAGSALLLSQGISSRTHAGFLTLISLHYGKTGVLTKDEARLFLLLFSLRHEGDYEDFRDATEDEVMEYMPKVRSLIGKLESLIEI